MGREIEYGLLTVFAQLEFPVRVHDEELCQEEALSRLTGKTPSRPLSLRACCDVKRMGFRRRIVTQEMIEESGACPVHKGVNVITAQYVGEGQLDKIADGYAQEIRAIQPKGELVGIRSRLSRRARFISHRS